MELKGFICNLGKYNEGCLVGKWVSFPIEEDDFNEVLKSIGIGSVDCFGCPYEEWFFADWDCEINLGLGEYERLSKVNEIAEALEEFGESDTPILEAIFGNYSDPMEALEIIMEENYRYYTGCNNMQELAEIIVDELDLLHDVPDFMKEYFDYEAYGRDLNITGNFLEVRACEANGYESGYVEIIC